MHSLDIKHKTILIVGASSGIGRQVAIQLSKGHNNIVLCARRKDRLLEVKEIVERNGSNCTTFSCDAMASHQAEQVLQATCLAFGKIDMALLNVGDGPSFNMANTSVDEIMANMDINYLSMVNFLVPLIRQMKKQKKGLIAHTNSLAGFLGLPMQGPYSAAKAACRVLMDATRIEVRPYNIDVVSIYPGFVATERVSDDGIPAPFEISEEKAARHVVKALASRKSDYLFPIVTGMLIRIAQILPKKVTSLILSKSVPKDY